MPRTTPITPPTDVGYSIRLLGGFRVSRGGAALHVSAGVQRVVGFLALQDGPVTRDYVAGALWPDRGEGRAHANLRSTLWRARREGPDLIASKGTALALVGDPAVDVRTVVEEARRLFTEPLVATPIDPGLFTQELLPDWFEDWVLIERERIRQISLHALDRLAAVLLSRREYARAVDVALKAVRAEPLRETARRVLLEIHLAEGNRSEAIREYERYCALLWEELELEPSAGLRALVAPPERSIRDAPVTVR